GTGNSFDSDSIFSNAGLGIDLGADGVTANDLADTDGGANNLQNYPILTNAFSDGASLLIEGTLNSAPNTDYALEFFANPDCDPSGYGQGRTIIDAEFVTTDDNGDTGFSFTIPTVVPAGQFTTPVATVFD